MRCLYCNRRISWLRSGSGPFCSEIHENRYKEEQAERLLNPFSDAGRVQPEPELETQSDDVEFPVLLQQSHLKLGFDPIDPEFPLEPYGADFTLSRLPSVRCLLRTDLKILDVPPEAGYQQMLDSPSRDGSERPVDICTRDLDLSLRTPAIGCESDRAPLVHFLPTESDGRNRFEELVPQEAQAFAIASVQPSIEVAGRSIPSAGFISEHPCIANSLFGVDAQPPAFAATQARTPEIWISPDRCERVIAPPRAFRSAYTTGRARSLAPAPVEPILIPRRAESVAIPKNPRPSISASAVFGLGDPKRQHVFVGRALESRAPREQRLLQPRLQRRPAIVAPTALFEPETAVFALAPDRWFEPHRFLEANLAMPQRSAPVPAIATSHLIPQPAQRRTFEPGLQAFAASLHDSDVHRPQFEARSRNLSAAPMAEVQAEARERVEIRVRLQLAGIALPSICPSIADRPPGVQPAAVRDSISARQIAHSGNSLFSTEHRLRAPRLRLPRSPEPGTRSPFQIAIPPEFLIRPGGALPFAESPSRGAQVLRHPKFRTVSITESRKTADLFPERVP